MDLHTACESIELTWQQPADLAPTQISHYSVLVAKVARSGDVVVLNQSIGLGTQYRTTGLFAATTYSVQVRAQNPKGSSRWSARLLATTPLPTKKPKALAAPSVLPAEDSCDVQLSLALPAVDSKAGACHGVEAVDVQMLTAGSAQWKTVLSQVVTTQARLEGPSGAAVVFRLLAHNRLGTSPPGEASPRSPVVVAGLPNVAAWVPKVRATGSASFAIEVPTVSASCQSSLIWTVFGSVASSPGSDAATWTVLASLGQGLQHSVDRMRCPSNGCKFRLRPAVNAFDDGEKLLLGTTVVKQNGALPPRPEAAARIELLLKGVEWNSLRRRELRRTLAQKLELKQEPAVIEEHAFPGGVYVILDLLSTDKDAASEAAQALAALLSRADRDDGSLGVLREVDVSTGLHQEAAIGEWTRVRPLPPKPNESAPFDAFSSEGRKRIGALLGGAVVCAVALCRFVRALCCGRRLPQGAMPLATQDPDEVEQTWGVSRFPGWS